MESVELVPYEIDLILLMKNKFSPGQNVLARLFPDLVLDRVVVKHVEQYVFLCTSDEWERSQVRGTEPKCVGMLERDVLISDTERL